MYTDTRYATIALTPDFKTSIAYKEILTGEDEDRETIVFLHGLSSSKESLLNTVALEMCYRALKNGVNLRMVAIDWPGHGQSTSDLERYSFKTLVTVLKKTLEFLDIEKCRLYGMSLGGIIAAMFTAENPNTVEELYIQGAPVNAKLWGRKGERVKRSLHLARRLRIKPPNSLDFLPDRLVPVLAYINPMFRLREDNLRDVVRNVPWSRDMFVQNARQLSPRVFLGYVDQILNTEVKAELETIRENGTPVLLIDGDSPEHPALDTTEYILSCIPDAEVLKIKDAGHIASMVGPDVIADKLIERFKNSS